MFYYPCPKEPGIILNMQIRARFWTLLSTLFCVPAAGAFDITVETIKIDTELEFVVRPFFAEASGKEPTRAELLVIIYDDDERAYEPVRRIQIYDRRGKPKAARGAQPAAQQQRNKKENQTVFDVGERVGVQRVLRVVNRGGVPRPRHEVTLSAPPHPAHRRERRGRGRNHQSRGGKVGSAAPVHGRREPGRVPAGLRKSANARALENPGWSCHTGPICSRH